MQCIGLHDEDMQEIMARTFVIRHLEERVKELFLAEHHAQQAVAWITETLSSVTVESPVYDMHVRGLLWAKQEHEGVGQDIANLRRHIALLQESLALFLARRYDFDPTDTQWVLSIERKTLECT